MNLSLNNIQGKINIFFIFLCMSIRLRDFFIIEYPSYFVFLSRMWPVNPEYVLIYCTYFRVQIVKNNRSVGNST